MENLVEKIIECDYNNLKDIKLIFNEKFGLIVDWDSVKYEFILNLKGNSNKLLVLGSGAIEPHSNHDRTKPIFHRWSWDFPMSTIYYNDPTLYLSTNILGGWGLGSMDNWYLEKISNILNIIFKRLSLKNNQIIFYGSSLGGFMSLMLSILIKDTTVIAEIPQLDITKWDKHWPLIKTHLFNNLSEKDIKENFNYKIDFIEFMKIEQYIPNAFLIFDSTDEYDLNNIYLPFFSRLNELPYFDNKYNLKIKIEGKNKGHSTMPYVELCSLIDSVTKLLD